MIGATLRLGLLVALTPWSGLRLSGATEIKSERYEVTTPLFLGDYIPGAFNSIEALPKAMRPRIEDYFRNKFSRTVVDRITFRTGCAINRAKAIAAGNSIGDVAYCLVYSVKAEKGAVSSFDFLLLIDEQGVVLNKPEFPAGACGNTLRFASASQVQVAARSVLDDWDFALLEYSERYGTLVWRIGALEKPFWRFRPEMQKLVFVDACSARVLGQRESQIIR